jgi:hypothetical protein
MDIGFHDFLGFLQTHMGLFFEVAVDMGYGEILICVI